MTPKEYSILLQNIFRIQGLNSDEFLCYPNDSLKRGLTHWVDSEYLSKNTAFILTEKYHFDDLPLEKYYENHCDSFSTTMNKLLEELREIQKPFCK